MANGNPYYQFDKIQSSNLIKFPCHYLWIFLSKLELLLRLIVKYTLVFLCVAMLATEYKVALAGKT